LKSIDFLHRNNIIHRDIKPSNVLLHKNELVLGDLGLAKDISIMSRSSLTTGIGTYPYMSPEVVTECKNYTNKIDIWLSHFRFNLSCIFELILIIFNIKRAFGCVLYEMIRLRRLFDSDNFMEIINAISNFRNEDLNLNFMNPTFQHALKRSIARESYQRLPAVYLMEILMVTYIINLF
jgi:serine/threonine protein kinase